MIEKLHWSNNGITKYSAYYYVDRYRFTHTTDEGMIAYFQAESDLLDSKEAVMALADSCKDIVHIRKTAATKCVRCGRPGSENRSDLNDAHVCDRCYDVIKNSDENSKAEGLVWYYINDDGTKGSVVK